MDVLVTGADQRQGLAVIRALGSNGCKVFAVGTHAKSLGFCSRYTAAHAQVPSPMSDKEAFASAILELVREHQIPLVIPVVESTVIALDEHRERFEGVSKLALPPPDALHLALDKRRTEALAKELGIPMPQAADATTTAGALEFAAQVGYPVVLKPRALGNYGTLKQARDFKVDYAQDATDLREKLLPFEGSGAFPIVQHYFPGVKHNHGFFYADGQLLGLMEYRGAREYPLTGGVTSLHESVPLDPERRAWTLKLLEAMQWDGIGMVEYKVNEETGEAMLLEVNGRFWATLSAACRIGMNFPYALYRYMKEGTIEPLPETYPERKSLYLQGDLIALAGHLLGHNADFLAPLPGKGRAIWNSLRDLRLGVQFDVLELRDWRPSVCELATVVRVNTKLYASVCFRKCFPKKP